MESTQQLPVAASVAASVGESIRICLVSLSDQWFAMDLKHVGEVFKVEGITPVPGMPSAVVGVTNLRGMIVPLVDVRGLLGLPAEGPLPFAVILRHGVQQVGVLVDRVPEIRSIVRGDLRPAGTGSGRHNGFVSAVLRLEERMGGMVEVPTLLAYVETS